MRNVLRRILLLTLGFVLAKAASFAQGERLFQCFVDGVYPVQLRFSPSGDSASYTYAMNKAPISLRGKCTSSDCMLRGVDSAMAIRVVIDSNELVGHVQLADARRLDIAGTATKGDAPFLTLCNNTNWIRKWVDEAGKYVLTTTQLPSGEIRGTFFIQALGTSFLVAGKAVQAPSTILELYTFSGRITGTLQLANKDEQSEYANAELLLLGEDAYVPSEADFSYLQQTRQLSLKQVEDLPTGCLQSNSTYDLVFPQTGRAKVDVELNRLATTWWNELMENEPAFAHGWFEPTRLDDALLSGWVHLQSSEQEVSYSLAIDRKSGKQLRETTLLGPRKERGAQRERARKQSIDRHPLKADPMFLTWAKAQDFDLVTVLHDGLAYSSEAHPVFGQLIWVETWSALGHSRRLPEWLTKPIKR